MHAFGFSPRKAHRFALERLYLQGYSKNFLLCLTNSMAGECTSGLPAMRACCRPPTGQKEALLAKGEALLAIDEALPATGVLNHHSATELKQRKMEGPPRVCLYCTLSLSSQNIKGGGLLDLKPPTKHFQYMMAKDPTCTHSINAKKQDSIPLHYHGWSKAMETKEISSFHHFEYEMDQSFSCSI